MKSTFVFAAVFLFSFNLFGQGTINLANNAASPVLNSLTRDPVPAGPGFSISLNYLPEGGGVPTSATFDRSGVIIGTSNSAFLAPGRFSAGMQLTPPTTPPGASCWCQVRVWETSFGPSYGQSILNSMSVVQGRRVLAGTSNIIKVQTASGLGFLPSPGSLVDAGLQEILVAEVPASELAINDASISPGNAGPVARFTVSLSASNLQPVSVSYATADGTAQSGVDYQPAYGSLTFLPSERVKTIAVDVTPNQPPGANKYFYMNLSDPMNAPIADSQGVATLATVEIEDFSVDAVITFLGQPNHVYAVDKTYDLSPPLWQPLVGSTNVGQGQLITVTDKGAGCITRGHYRVRLVE